MALYTVMLDGKKYVNPTLFRQANGFGPAATAKAVASGSAEPLTILDDLLYLIDAKDKKYASFADASGIQDIDKTLEQFHLCDKEELFALRAMSGQKKAMVAAIPKPKQILEFKGWKLVRMHDVSYSSKYHLRDRMAVLQVCGSFYVALNARLKREAAPVVITIKA